MSPEDAQLIGLIKDMAPGVEVEIKHHPAYAATQVRLRVEVDESRMVADRAQTDARVTAVQETTMSLLPEVQKRVVKAIGLEDYVRARELAVLDRAQERIHALVSGMTESGEAADRLASQLTDDLRSELGA